MKVYLAGSLRPENRPVLAAVAEELHRDGYDVFAPHEQADPNSLAAVSAAIDELGRADKLVIVDGAPMEETLAEVFGVPVERLP